MASSPDKIRVSHAGTLPRPEGLKELLLAESGLTRAQAKFAAAVADVVRKQADLGIDIVNDGEFSKVRGFSEYVRERLGGLAASGSKRQLSVMARDLRDFPGFVGGKFARHVDFSAASGAECIAPLTYIGTAIAKTDIANLRAATDGLGMEAYVPSIAPGTIEHWLTTILRAAPRSSCFAIADAMSQEYKAHRRRRISAADRRSRPAGRLADVSGHDGRRVSQIRERCGSTRSITHCGTSREEKIRLHICWGSNHGPHKNDIPFADIIDIFCA